MAAGQHNFQYRLGRLHWFYCVHCGLILLNNRRTERAVRKPCVTE